MKNRSAFWLSHTTSGNISVGNEDMNSKEHNTPMFIEALLTVTKTWKQPKYPSVDEWIKQLWNIYTMEYYLALKKKKNFTFCDSMDGPGEHYVQWNKPLRERQILYDFTHMWNAIKTELASKIETDL